VNSFDFDFAQLSAMLSRISPPVAETPRADRASDSPVKTGNSTDVSGCPTEKVLAIVPTHLFGFPADIASIRKMIRDPDITIVEDAAQAMGETWEGRKLGTLGDVSFFSLGRGKAFSAVEGGIILTNRDDVAEALNRRVNSLPRYGFWQLASLIAKAGGMMLFLHPLLFWIPRSIPFLRLGETLFELHFPMLKMSSFQAGLARNWQKRVEALRDARKKSVDRWIAVLEKGRVPGQRILASRSRGLLRFPIRLGDQKKRESLLRESYRRGLGIMPLYPTSVNAIPELSETIRDGMFPVAESIARELVTLPTHAYLTDDDVTEIGALVSRALG
jgi:dTDP-4-amino-4,6-dideoxygalactose transaminase